MLEIEFDFFPLYSVLLVLVPGRKIPVCFEYVRMIRQKGFLAVIQPIDNIFPNSLQVQ